MSRNRLRIFSPQADFAPEESLAELHEEAHVISFESARRAIVVSRRLQPANKRARLIHQNSQCPDCNANLVEPIELNDGVMARGNRLSVPGTATLVGFHCCRCGYEWPVTGGGSDD